MVAGRKTSELKQILQERFGVSYNQASTLVRTEMSHIQTQAARERYRNAGLTEVEVWADKDERRCDMCGELHQKRFNINGVMPIPAHPNCRCSILPVLDTYKAETETLENLGYKEEPQPEKTQPKQQNLTLQENDDNIKIPKDMLKQSTKRLEKTIISDTERIEEHEYKIAHPEEFYDDWGNCPEHIK